MNCPAQTTTNQADSAASPNAAAAAHTNSKPPGPWHHQLPASTHVSMALADRLSAADTDAGEHSQMHEFRRGPHAPAPASVAGAMGKHASSSVARTPHSPPPSDASRRPCRAPAKSTLVKSARPQCTRTHALPHNRTHGTATTHSRLQQCTHACVRPDHHSHTAIVTGFDMHVHHDIMCNGTFLATAVRGHTCALCMHPKATGCLVWCSRLLKTQPVVLGGNDAHFRYPRHAGSRH